MNRAARKVGRIKEDRRSGFTVFLPVKVKIIPLITYFKFCLLLVILLDFATFIG